MYNPWATWRISCDWDCHRKRGSAGGTDYAVPVGTPIRASFDGYLKSAVGIAGVYKAVLTRADGLAFYHLHLSRFVANGYVQEGEIIGYSGGRKGSIGAGTSTGPHLHAVALWRGVWSTVYDWFPRHAATKPASLPVVIPVVIPIEKEEIDMAGIILVRNTATVGEFRGDIVALSTGYVRRYVGDTRHPIIARVLGGYKDVNGDTEMHAVLNAFDIGFVEYRAVRAQNTEAFLNKNGA